MSNRRFYFDSQLADELRSLSNDRQELLTEAEAYLRLFPHECGTLDAYRKRIAEIQDEIEQRGTYWHSSEELTYGAKLAWRNNTRGIGRLHWKCLVVRDMRHLQTAEDIFAALVDHLRFATNGGKIRSTITIFAPQTPGQPGIRIWNPQLIRYAGYRRADGSVLGDPLHVELTELALHLGWKGAKDTPFDVLPLVTLRWV